MTSTGLNCSQISALHLLQQENLRAGQTLVECGIVPGGSLLRTGVSGQVIDPPVPPNILVSNRSCVNAQNCTKSENMVWAHGCTIVINYNDHNAGQYSGTSYSTGCGNTFTQLPVPPFATGHGVNFGDPIVVYNEKLGLWYAGDLVGGCGGQGIGLWTSTTGITWTPDVCVHNGTADDRESMWVDNDPSSPYYGRMYISWNDFSVGGGALFVADSDHGWVPKRLSTGFIRDVQITGRPVGPVCNSNTPLGHVFVAAMDEGGGNTATRQNWMYRSTDGNKTWTAHVIGARFNPVGDSACASNNYFYKVNPNWRHMGWGEPGVGLCGEVHYAYAGQGVAPNDHGDIYYVYSTDDGQTWSSPVVLNSDVGGQFKTQWMPSLSVEPSGTVTVSWYDRRQATTACNTNPTDPGCNYERWARQSTVIGVWNPEFVISQIIPQPDQQDPQVQSCYAGDYDYDTAVNGMAFITWTDGRVNVGGVQVQNVQFATIP